MVVKEIIDNDEANYGQYGSVTLIVDGKRAFRIGGGEPEDMTLGRDLSDAYSVSKLMQQAYEAGQRGEPFEFESVEEES